MEPFPQERDSENECEDDHDDEKYQGEIKRWIETKTPEDLERLRQSFLAAMEERKHIRRRKETEALRKVDNALPALRSTYIEPILQMHLEAFRLQQVGGRPSKNVGRVKYIDLYNAIYNLIGESRREAIESFVKIWESIFQTFIQQSILPRLASIQRRVLDVGFCDQAVVDFVTAFLHFQDVYSLLLAECLKGFQYLDRALQFEGDMSLRERTDEMVRALVVTPYRTDIHFSNIMYKAMGGTQKFETIITIYDESFSKEVLKPSFNKLTMFDAWRNQRYAIVRESLKTCPLDLVHVIMTYEWPGW